MSSEKSATRRKPNETGDGSSSKGSNENLNVVNKNRFSTGIFYGESTTTKTTATTTTTDTSNCNKTTDVPKSVVTCPDDSPNYLVYKKVKII